MKRSPVYLVKEDGKQDIELPDNSNRLVSLQVLEPSGYVRTIHLDNFQVDNNRLFINENANIRAGDKIAGFYM